MIQLVSQLSSSGDFDFNSFSMALVHIHDSYTRSKIVLSFCDLFSTVFLVGEINRAVYPEVHHKTRK